MRKFFIIFLTIILSSTHALGDKIVAIVGDSPITKSELQSSKKILKHFDLLKNLSQEEKENLEKSILELVINDKVLENFANETGTKVSEEELQAMIAAMAKGKKVSVETMLKDLESSGIDIKAFENKTKIEILRGKLMREHIARNVDISSKDIESMVLSTNYRNAQLNLQILTAKRNDQKSYKKLEKMRKRIKSCNSLKKIYFTNFANLSEVNTTMSMLSPSEQALAIDLPIGTPSPVIEDTKLKIFVVCSRELQEFSSEDHFNVANFLGNKKMSLNAQKFFQKLRKKAYVKIVE